MDDNLTTIHLGGKLGVIFGAKWHLRVASPAEAIKAININTKGEFIKYLRNQGEKKYYKIAIGKKNNLIDKEELANRSGKSDIYILPTVRGAGSGWGKIIAAIVIVIATYYLGPAGAGLLNATGTTVGYMTAASLFVGGVVQLLTPVPNFNNNSADSTHSSIFAGNATTVTQGSAVGIIYGRALASPVPISISFDNQDTSSTYYPSSSTDRYTVVTNDENNSNLLQYVATNPNIQNPFPTYDPYPIDPEHNPGPIGIVGTIVS